MTEANNQILGYATDIFKSEDTAMEWLNTHQPELGWQTPASVMGSEEGVSEVKALLDRVNFLCLLQFQDRSDRDD